MKRARPAVEEVADGTIKAEVCSGISKAWGAKFRGEEHIAFHRHLPCKNCGADLGCVRCSGPTRELLCRRCEDWGHPDALAEHGRLLKGVERDVALHNLTQMIGAFGPRKGVGPHGN